MLFDNKPYTLDRIVRIGISAGLIWGLIWLLGYLSDVLIPFAIAFLLAYLMNPLVVLIQKKIPNRIVAVFISLFLVLVVLVLLIVLITPLIIDQISHTGRLVFNLIHNSELADRAARRLPPDIWQAIRTYFAREDVLAFFRTENFLKLAEAIARKVLPGLWGVVAGTTNFLISMVGLAVIGLYLVFLLFDFQKFREDWEDLIPVPYRDDVVGFMKDFNAGMNQYFRAQALVAAIVGVLFAIGFTIIGLPLGILLGLFIGLLNMVPYLQVVGLIPAFLLALARALQTGTSFWQVLGLTVLVFIVVQIIQDGFLVPRFMKKATGLSPAIILLSLSIWGKLLGIFGLLIALPMTCLLLAYYQRFLKTMNKTESVVT